MIELVGKCVARLQKEARFVIGIYYETLYSLFVSSLS